MLDAGADKNIKDYYDKSAVDYFEEVKGNNKNKDIFQVLNHKSGI